MEVLYLPLRADGTFRSFPAMRRRLGATPLRHAVRLLSLIVIFIAAGADHLYMLPAPMRSPLVPREVLVLSVFLLMSLALSQALALLRESLRLYLGLILLLLLSVAGGCFLQLPEQLLRFPGQYLPQGWALAALRGFPVLPPALVTALSLLALLMLYPLHMRSVRKAEPG